jgi:hypothetical protein
MIELINNFFKRISGNYGNDLESFITSRDPKNEGDVERLTLEYNTRLLQNRYY